MGISITGLVPGAERARAIISDLQEQGIPWDAISIVVLEAQDRRGGDAAARPAGGGGLAQDPVAHLSGGALGCLAGMCTVTIPGVGPLISRGPMMAVLSGSAATLARSRGGINGTLTGLGIPADRTDRYAEGIRAGRILIAATAFDAAFVEPIRQIFDHADAEEITTIPDRDLTVHGAPERTRLTWSARPLAGAGP
jgi:hypothetical protein